MEEKITMFWETYEAYVSSYNDNTPKIEMRPILSALLAEIETADRVGQLVHHKNPEYGILGWQVLKDKTFFNGKNCNPVLELYAGELLGWDAPYDRDVFLSRIPYKEVVSGYALNPGRTRLDDNKYIYNDERGLYLPIYHPEIFMNIYNKEILRGKPLVFKYLQEVKGVLPNVVMMYS